MLRPHRKFTSYEMTKLGGYLKQLRKEGGLSIRAMAKESKLAPSYLSKLEAGDTFLTISVQALLKVSKAYDVPPIAILKEAGLIDSDEYDLPELAQYLRTKYHLSSQAIRDMEMAKKIVDEKYKK